MKVKLLLQRPEDSTPLIPEPESPLHNIDLGELFVKYHDVDSLDINPNVINRYKSEFVSLGGSVCSELIDRSKSDYVIFCDYTKFKYDISGLNQDKGNITYEQSTIEGQLPVTYIDSGELPPNPKNHIATYSEILGYNLVTKSTGLIPASVGDVLDLEITYRTHGAVSNVSSSFKLTEYDSMGRIDGMEFTGEYGDVTYPSTIEVCTYQSDNTEYDLGNITFFQITNGLNSPLFEVIFNTNNLYLYCINDNVDSYYISSCKINKLIPSRNE